MPLSHRQIEDLFLPALAERLEQALGLIASAEARAHLEQMAILCSEAFVLAKAANSLLAGRR